MAVKISLLTNEVTAPAADDILPIVDKLANETKRIEVRNLVGPKNNFTAVSGPTVNDDETQGYSIGSRWAVGGASEFVCLDASTGAAVWVLVASAAAAPSDDVLWEWNRTDTSQFDTGAPIVHQRDLGGASGSVTMTFVADAWQGEPVLRLAGTVQGGHIIPVKSSEITLPERYVIEMRLRRVSVSSVPALCAMFFHESSGVVNGLYFSRGTGSSAGAFSGVKADLQTVSTAGGTFAAWNATAEAHGGGVYRCEVWRQAGANPTRLAVRVTGDEPTARGAGAFNESTTTLTDWDGLDMGRLGLGIYCGGSATAGEADFLDLRVLRHPLDR